MSGYRMKNVSPTASLVPNMTNRYLTEARGLFEQAEGETVPSRKFAALEEAFELVDLVQGDLSLPRSDQELAENMRHSNIRRLLGQLVEMRAIQFGDWFDYIQLLLMQNDVKTALEEDPSLNAGYQDFVAIWKDELIEALGHD
jgi:hypothetical protein